MKVMASSSNAAQQSVEDAVEGGAAVQCKAQGGCSQVKCSVKVEREGVARHPVKVHYLDR